VQANTQTQPFTYMHGHGGQERVIAHVISPEEVSVS
jgi:hypothetical protein